MDGCKKVGKNLVAYLYGELKQEKRELVKRHLASCRACRGEMEAHRGVCGAADSFGRDADDVMRSVDWDSLPSRLVDRLLEMQAAARKKHSRSRFFSFPLKPVYAGLVISLILGSIGTWLVIRGGFGGRGRGETYFASREFLERADLEIARRETLKYLEKSQVLLLDFVQTSPERPDFFRDGLSVQRTKDLLSKKKFLNPRLSDVRMAIARNICDQIELLFLELADVAETLSADQVREIQGMIETKRILLKIKLLKKELEESEVQDEI